MTFMYFTEGTSNKNRGQTPPTPLLKEKTNHQPARRSTVLLSRRTGDERDGTDEDKDTTAQWRSKWIMANTTKYKLLPTADQAQDQRRTINGVRSPFGNSLLETQRTRRATYKARRT